MYHRLGARSDAAIAHAQRASSNYLCGVIIRQEVGVDVLMPRCALPAPIHYA